MAEFINPYNFIPLGSKRAEQGETSGTFTGVIEYSVLTKTPLFIPNTSCDERFVKGVKDHKSYDFFSYRDLSGDNGEPKCDRPVIPGSEMRGMIRSIYEVMTNSCMSALDEDVILSKRIAEVYKAGLIHRESSGRYSLMEAEDCIWRTKGENSAKDEENWRPEYYNRKCYIQKDFPEGTRVTFVRQKRERGKTLALKVRRFEEGKRGGLEGYIIKGEPGPEQMPRGNMPSPQKHCCHIFQLKQSSKPMPLKDELENLKSLLKMYEKNKEGDHEGYKEYKDELERFLAGKGEVYFPVYYSNETGFLWLSPASITREIYSNKLKDLAGTYKSCSEKAKLCPACSLFGTLGKEFAVSSRLRFEDLKCEEHDSYEKCFEPPTTLYPLSSPRLGNIEFYVKRPSGAVFWTYDYYIDAKGALRRYKPELNGRKFYWHQIGKKLPAHVEKSGQNITVRPLKKNIAFTGKLYFQKITEKELNRLIWILNGGEETGLSEKRYGYRLGAAKPLGLGSIAVAVDRVCLRKAVMQDGKLDICEEKYEPENTGELFAKDQIEQFRRCMAFDAVRAMEVQYPCTDKNKGTDGYTVGEGFLWFVGNHVTKTGRMTQKRKEMCYKEYLKPMEPKLKEVEEVGKFLRDSRGGSYGNGNRNNNQRGNGPRNNYRGNQNGKGRR